MSEHLIWIDCEMTGLDLANDALIEVAALVTDADLNVLGEGVEVVIRPPEAALAGMGEFVRTMHQDSGLLPLLETGLNLAEGEQMLLAYIQQHVPQPRRAPLAGNTVGTDRSFLLRDMPALESHLHYRNVDVSSLKELARRWYPRVYYNTPNKTGNHRALADIKESIQELRYYRDALFLPAPGLATAVLRDLAAKHQSAPGPEAVEVGTD